MATERLFVIGPSTLIEYGIVGEAEVAKWGDYLRSEGQPPLTGTAAGTSILRAERMLPPKDLETDIEFRLELAGPEFEFDEPGVITWRMYFEDVHHIMASSISDLVAALQAAKWDQSRIARFASIDLDEELPKGCEEEDEYCQMPADGIDEENQVEGERPLIGPTECAWDLLKSVSGSLPEESSGEKIIGKLRIDPEDGDLRTVFAVGELALTAVQALLNSAGSGVQVEFVDPPEWRSVNHPLLMESRDAEIARAVVDRIGLGGRAREHAILQLMCPWVAGRFRKAEHLADVHWVHEQAGFEGGGRFWFDLRMPMPEFVEACRTFTFEDWYDHCPESQRIYQQTPGYEAYHFRLFSIDLAAWTIRPLTEDIYSHMQATSNCLERWIAGFTENNPSLERVAYLTRHCFASSGLPHAEEPFRILGT